jgi:hypothetical protein
MPVTPLQGAYLSSYCIACLAALVLLLRERRRIVLLQRRYRLYLISGWKLVTFAIAALAMTIMAPYTGDPTWDYVDASVMAVLTYLTAPWAVGTLYLAFRRQAAKTDVYIAVCIWMLSVSWFYDVYSLVRNGYYPPTWLANIVLSSILYLAAGLMWNLQRARGRGVVFGFMAPGWPEPRNELGFGRIAWFALPIMVLVTMLIAPFLL